MKPKAGQAETACPAFIGNSTRFVMKSVKYLQLMEVAALRPGTAVDDVVAAGDRHLADFGHGVGADTPEHPRLLYGTGRRIEAGMVLAVCSSSSRRRDRLHRRASSG